MTINREWTNLADIAHALEQIETGGDATRAHQLVTNLAYDLLHLGDSTTLAVFAEQLGGAGFTMQDSPATLQRTGPNGKVTVTNIGYAISVGEYDDAVRQIVADLLERAEPLHRAGSHDMGLTGPGYESYRRRGAEVVDTANRIRYAARVISGEEHGPGESLPGESLLGSLRRRLIGS